jgi:predicted O-methyltransferase YrrM
MTNARSEIVNLLWYGRDPLAGFPRAEYAVDHQGWNSHHSYLARAIDEVRPRVVVEVGVWKGGSVLTLANRIKELDLDAVVIAIDTWLGSSEHWTDPALHLSLNHKNGFPQLYHCFAANVMDRELQDVVVPLPLDSVNAFHVLRKLGVHPDVLHIDAGHDFQSVTQDLNVWWPFLKPGGALVGDDYFADGSIWPEVQQAFDAFFGNNRTMVFESGDNKCYIRKPF